MQALCIKRGILAAGCAVLLGVAALGVAAAQQTPAAPSPEPRPERPLQQYQQRLIEAVAAKLNVSPDALRQALQEARQEVAPQRRKTESLQGMLRQWFGRRAMSFVRHELAVAAGAMNLTPQALAQQLPGKSLAQVAQENGVDPAVVASALKADLHARVDQAVASNRLPADRAQQLKDRIDAQVDRAMTRQIPAQGPRPSAPPRAPRG